MTRPCGWGSRHYPFGGLQLDDAALQRQSDRPCTVASAKLRENALEMALRCVLCDAEVCRNTLVTVAGSNKREHFDLARGQRALARMLCEFDRNVRVNALLPAVYRPNRFQKLLTHQTLEYVGLRTCLDCTH